MRICNLPFDARVLAKHVKVSVLVSAFSALNMHMDNELPLEEHHQMFELFYRSTFDFSHKYSGIAWI